MNRLLTLAVGTVLSAALACAGPQLARGPIDAKRVVPGPGQKIVVDHTVLVVDASSSISEDSLFPHEKALIEAFAKGMPDGSYQAGTLAFGGSKRQTTPLAKFDRSRIQGAASNLRYIGRGTPLPDVLNDVKAKLSGAQGDVAILIFSDGAATSGGRRALSSRVLSAGEALVAAQPGQVCIHGVQVGDSMRGAHTLRNLAALTPCGTFRKSTEVFDTASLHGFQSEVFLGEPALPAVAAPPPAPTVTDQDGDGVLDRSDQCPGTPRGAPVNASGCWAMRDLHFPFDSAEITARYRSDLDEIAAVLRNNPNLGLNIEGHTDAIGTDAYNKKLSQRRAEAVKRYLVSKGVDAKRLQTSALGEGNFIATNETDQGRALNRRGTLKLR